MAQDRLIASAERLSTTWTKLRSEQMAANVNTVALYWKALAASFYIQQPNTDPPTVDILAGRLVITPDMLPIIIASNLYVSKGHLDAGFAFQSLTNTDVQVGLSGEIRTITATLGARRQTSLLEAGELNMGEEYITGLNASPDEIVKLSAIIQNNDQLALMGNLFDKVSQYILSLGQSQN